jgi:hypothetical protein
VLVYERIDGLEIPPGCSGPRQRLTRSSKPRWRMPAAALRRIPLSVTDRRALLSVSEGQAGPRATAPGSTEVTAACGVPARPHQDGHDLTPRTPPRCLTVRCHDLGRSSSSAAPDRGLRPRHARRRSRQAADQYPAHQHLGRPGPRSRAPARDFAGAAGRPRYDRDVTTGLAPDDNRRDQATWWLSGTEEAIALRQGRPARYPLDPLRPGQQRPAEVLA